MHKGCPMRKFWKHHGMFGMHHPMHHGMFGGMNHGFGMHHPMHHGFDMHHGMFGMNHPMFDMNMNQMSPFNYNQFDQYPSQFQQNPFVQEQEQEDEYQDEKPWKKFTKKGKKAKNDFGRRQGRRGRRGMGMEMQQFEDEMNENIPPQQEQEPKEKK
ncbi:hypothetical protein M0811_05315 [Anaeramoeba ignava]|uniref:Uncharacterized protein n=1 Tax=Anaeramoeba ignava TaxID=1746090 RepID=A0A9Q0RFU4_ANAIG|nr:hypothetical protein M0811_05315 [Anaeramoeba ignava]